MPRNARSQYDAQVKTPGKRTAYQFSANKIGERRNSTCGMMDHTGAVLSSVIAAAETDQAHSPLRASLRGRQRVNEMHWYRLFAIC